MVDDETPGSRAVGRTLLGVGLSVGLVIGLAVGSVIALRVGADALDAMRGIMNRFSTRSNQVHFELLLQ